MASAGILVPKTWAYWRQSVMMTKGLEHKVERAGTVRPAEGSGGSCQCASNLDGMEGSGGSQECIPTGQEAMAQIKTHEIPLEHKETHFPPPHCEGGSKPVRGCPDRLWHLHPWRRSNPSWTWSWATGSAAVDGLQRCLST